MKNQQLHWADINAEKIIREKGDKNLYVCASGITPSGTVHIGNFREIISVELIVRALKDMGKKVRFIYSWDDYDVFRKVPPNMPQPELLETYLRQPITSVPDTTGHYGSYAEANEKALEPLLPEVGIQPEYIYQAAKYRQAGYAAGIRRALERKDIIMDILNEFRTEPLSPGWWPVSVFSTFTNRDTTTVLDWDKEWRLTYRCDDTGKTETVDLRQTSQVKLPWRIDWPMRWKEEQVDFEPAGKDHHSEGGSFDTARKVVKAVYDWEPPVTFQYDFVRIKGGAGKISSSGGEVVGLQEVLEIYQPEIVRYLFAGTRPNSEFAVSFDLDVLKIYEDYDKCERIYFGAQEVGEKKRAKEGRIYELSQIAGPPQELPFQVPFRHLCNLLQIHSGSVEAVLALFPDITAGQQQLLRKRAVCAWNWITKYSPEDFRFSLNLPSPQVPPAEVPATEGLTTKVPPAEVPSETPAETPPAGPPAANSAAPEQSGLNLSANARQALSLLAAEVESFEKHDEKSLAERIYAIAAEADLDPKELFILVYQVLIKKNQGPRLAGFMLTVGKDKLKTILTPYL